MRATPCLTGLGLVVTIAVVVLGLPGPVDGLVGAYGARLDDADTTLKVASAAAAAFLALAALGRYELSRVAQRFAEQKALDDRKLAEAGQITERFGQAVQLLGGNLDVRLGGIYALERIAKDSRADAQTVVDVLCAFIREHTSELRRDESPPLRESASAPQAATDVAAALTVVSRVWEYFSARRIDLHDADLGGVSIPNGNLSEANLCGANLRGANLFEVKLTGAYLMEANLSRTVLDRSNLAGSHLNNSNLTDAGLAQANLTDASMLGANLSDIDLFQANLTGADLRNATLNTADMREATLTGVKWLGAKWDDDCVPPVWPEGFDWASSES